MINNGVFLKLKIDNYYDLDAYIKRLVMPLNESFKQIASTALLVVQSSFSCGGTLNVLYIGHVLLMF